MDFAIGSQSTRQIFIELLDLPFPDGAPQTVENFLRYIESIDPDTNAVVRRYDNTFIHRSISGFVIQGGGFAYTPNPQGEDFARDFTEVVIDLDANGQEITVPNEFDASRSNVRGTVAMAKVGGDPDSATSQWFINIGNNAGNLDNQNGGFTVFGRVIGMTADNAGTTVADEIAALATANKTDVHSAFSNLPLFGFTQGDPIPDVSSTNLVRLVSATVVELVQPSALDFGLTPLDTTRTQTVTVENRTDFAFTILSVGDGLQQPFSILSGDENCSNKLLGTINDSLASRTCSIIVSFHTEQAGEINSSLDI
ncbi:MAG: peptidylprolyl isomerase, partial [Thiogranum sp.]